MKRVLFLIAAVFMMLPALAQSAKQKGYVVVTDYLKADDKTDVSDALQRIIDENPNRTIFFPDGLYLISKPILTPADPKKSVALELSNYAVIKAMEGWAHDEAMVRLGGKDPFNNIATPGSNYYLEGGVIDGSGVAKGVSIDSGRETVIRNTSIKGVVLGIHIKHGANSGSSDCDIFGVNIVGNQTKESVGVLVEGYDNTFTNMRIGGVHVGFHIRSAANSLTNIHPLYYGTNGDYHTSCGFRDEQHDNWYNFCYSDEFATAFENSGGHSIYNHCYAYWYSKRGDKHTVFRSTQQFNSDVMNMLAGFGGHNATKENVVLEEGDSGGEGVIFNLRIKDAKYVTSETHKKYMR